MKVKLRKCDGTIIEENPLFSKGNDVALIFPGPYKAMAQSLGFHIVYAILRSYGLKVERFTSDSCGSLESGRPLKRFKVLLASIPFELGYLSLARILVRYGIELDPSRRKKRLIVGGIAPTANPVPILGIADAVVLGEAEVSLPRLIESDFSLDLPWIATLDSDAERGYVDLNKAPVLSKHPIPLNIEPPWGRGFMIDVTRGCPFYCRFCLESWVSKPYRSRPIETVKEAIRRSGERRVILISLSLGTYSWKELLTWLVEEGFEASLPSLRPSFAKEMADLIKKLGQRTVTIAPETFNKKKSIILGKSFPFEEVYEVVKELKRRGLKTKLYMMTSIPGEDVEDAKEDVEKIRILKKEGVHVSVNPLIPKPWTPMQYFPIKPNFKLVKLFEEVAEIYDPYEAFLQGALSLAYKPLRRSLLAPLNPKKALEHINEEMSLKPLLKVRDLSWEPPWMKYKISNRQLLEKMASHVIEIVNLYTH